MKIHVTGANGFLGGYVRRALSQRGHDLVLTDVDVLDVTDLEAAIAALTPDTELVCHLAGLTGAQASAASPRRYFEVNATGTLNVLEACRRNGIPRVVFMSTLTVHGASPEPVDESSPMAPRHPYAASKAAAEMMLSTYARSFAVSSATLRATLIAGEGQAEPNAVSQFAATALEGRAIELYGDGGHQREWLHPADLAAAVAAAVDWLAAQGDRVAERFIVSSRAPIAMAALAEKVISRVGRGELTFSHPTAQAFSLTTSSTKARDLLGWRAAIGIDEIVDRVVREVESARGASPRAAS
jgi:nucleoside-diphosphate-sugar epimerase